MVGARFFSGGRDAGSKESLAREILKIEKQKGGKLTSQERFKLIMERKMTEHRKEVEQAGQKNMSIKAQQALKQIAMKKAAKQAKVMRQSVIVQQKYLNNGMVTKSGKILDIAGNQIGQINKKNGKINTVGGMSLGQYKANSRSVNSVIMGAIDKYSPYYMNLRKMQAMQAQGLDPATGLPLNQQVIDVHGNNMGAHAAMLGGGYQSMAGQMMMQQHQEGSHGNGIGAGNYVDMDVAGERGRPVSGTAWGAMSDNVWGTFSDNVWGSTGDNVWGTASTDVWGGVGTNAWAGRTTRVWGTGDGRNRLKFVASTIRKLLGRVNKNTLKAFQSFRKSGGVSSARQASAAPRTPPPRSGGRR